MVNSVNRSRTSQSLAEAGAIVLIVATGTFMFRWTAGRWADPIYNSGREIYVPWQLAAGKVLYRDIAHAPGPISQYFNSILMRGAARPLAHRLIAANLILFALLVAMIYWLWRQIADRLAAACAALLLVLLFGFIQLTSIGGFNYMLPIQHEMTHGVILAFATLCCFATYLRRHESRWLMIAGVLLGMIFLTKPEILVATFPPMIAGTCAAMYARRASTRQFAQALATLILPSLLAPIIAVSWLSDHMQLADAVAAIRGSWRWSFDDRLTSMAHYEAWLGMDRPDVSFERILFASFSYALLLGPTTVLGWLLRKPGEARVGAAVAAAIVVSGILYVLYDLINWQYVPAGLTLVMAVVAIAMSIALLKRPRGAVDRVMILRLTIVWFALLLLSHLGLRAVIFEYGFVLAMPATLLGVAAIVSWVPAMIDRAGGFGWVPRAAALASIAMFATFHLRLYAHRIRPGHVTIGEGADAMSFDRRGLAFRDVLRDLQARAKPTDTVMAIPDGAMINVLSARTNPTPYLSLMPPEMAMFSQPRVLKSIQRSPPDWLVVTTTEARAYGVKGFAIDYGRDIWRWLDPRYERVMQSGERDFKMALFRRRSDGESR